MSRNNDPTERDKKYLTDLGIHVPFTWPACMSLREFLGHAEGHTKEFTKRLKRLRELQEKWVGKTVTYKRNDTKVGEVEYLQWGRLGQLQWFGRVRWKDSSGRLTYTLVALHVIKIIVQDTNKEIEGV